MNTYFQYAHNSFLTFLLSLFLFFAVTNNSYSQSPFQFNTKKEIIISGIGLGIGGIGGYLGLQTKDLTIDELNSLDPLQINSFDRGAVSNNSELARDISDIFLYGGNALPFTLFMGKRVRADKWRMPLMWIEGHLINAGLTGFIKNTARRPRPYVFNPDTELTERQSSHARSSFLSGHTSVTSYNAFFTAQTYAQYYPNSKAKVWVWAGAAIIPAVTGYLRVKGGRHYPSDVIAGYALGAIVGILIPKIHLRR